MNFEAGLKMLDVEHSYGAKDSAKVLDGVNLECPKGQIVTLEGASGGGKTTVLMLLAGLLTPTKGRVSFVEKQGHESAVCLGQAQILFQQPFSSLNPFFSIERTLREALWVHERLGGAGDAQSKIETLLEMVGLDTQILRKKPSQISGGQCQLVSLARALCAKPDILLCDEITSSLDARSRNHILDLLLELKRLSKVIVFVSHDKAACRYVADQSYTLDGGKIHAKNY